MGKAGKNSVFAEGMVLHDLWQRRIALAARGGTPSGVPLEADG